MPPEVVEAVQAMLDRSVPPAVVDNFATTRLLADALQATMKGTDAAQALDDALSQQRATLAQAAATALTPTPTVAPFAVATPVPLLPRAATATIIRVAAIPPMQALIVDRRLDACRPSRRRRARSP